MQSGYTNFFLNFLIFLGYAVHQVFFQLSQVSKKIPLN